MPNETNERTNERASERCPCTVRMWYVLCISFRLYRFYVYLIETKVIRKNIFVVPTCPVRRLRKQIFE